MKKTVGIGANKGYGEPSVVLVPLPKLPFSDIASWLDEFVVEVVVVVVE